MRHAHTYTHLHLLCQDSAYALNSLTQLLLILPASSPSSLPENTVMNGPDAAQQGQMLDLPKHATAHTLLLIDAAWGTV